MGKTPDIPTLYGDISLSPLGPYDRRAYVSPVDYKVSYINNLPMPVTIGWRSGLKFVLPQQFSMSCNLLIIRVEITINYAAKLDIQKLLSRVDDSGTCELKAMREAFAYQIKENIHGGVTLTLDYALTAERLRKLGGIIYYQELDIVVSIKDIDETPPHPHSEEGRRLKLINVGFVNKDDNDFTFNIKLVDNFNRYGPRFINICNKVYKIKTSKDITKRDGVYITSNKVFEGDVKDVGEQTTITYYEIGSEDIELFLTNEDAVNLGDTATSRKLRVAELEQDTVDQKAELQTIKHEFDLLMMEKNKERLILEMEREKHKQKIDELRSEFDNRLRMDREKQKDYNEERSYTRREQSELIKWLPSIITGIGSVIAAILAVKKK